MTITWYTYVSFYILIGTAFTASIDHILNRNGDEEIKFTNVERLLCIALWPLYLIIFIANYKP